MVQQAADGKEKGPVHVRIGADALDRVRVTLTNFKVPQNTTQASISCRLSSSPLGRHFAPPKVTEAKDKTLSSRNLQSRSRSRQETAKGTTEEEVPDRVWKSGWQHRGDV